MKTLAGIGAVVLGVVAVVGLVLGIAFGSFELYKYFAPKYQAVEREVFENTPSFVQGKEQTISELRFEYNRAQTQGEKTNIEKMVVNEAAAIDIEKIKDESLQRFIRDCRSN